jgi:hypothetical protein
MNGYLRPLIAVALAAIVGCAHASSPVTWPVSPSRMELSTPYGRLHVSASEYVYESRLLIDNDEVKPTIRGILNITYAFRRADELVALISINNGNNLCPIVYRWVILDKSGYTLSPEFGSCSEHIAVSANGRVLTMRTPSPQKPDKNDVYTYDGRTVRRSTASK